MEEGTWAACGQLGKGKAVGVEQHPGPAPPLQQVPYALATPVSFTVS